MNRNPTVNLIKHNSSGGNKLKQKVSNYMALKFPNPPGEKLKNSFDIRYI